MGSFFFTPTTITQKVVVKHRNKVVKVRPNKPKIVIVKPNKVKRNYMGSWSLEMEFKKRKIYLDQGKMEKKKRHRQWVSGRWKEVPGGYIWIDGYWKK